MDNHVNVTPETLDSSGQYDSGLKSLVKSLQVAFVLLVVVILGMLIYFFTLGGYFTVKPQESVMVFRFGKFVGVYDKGWHWFFPYPVNSFIRFKTNQQTLRVSFEAEQPLALPGGEMPKGGPLQPGRDGYLITADANIVHSSWVVNYEIADVKKYYDNFHCPPDPRDDDTIFTDDTGFVLGSRGPQTFLRSLMENAVIRVTSLMLIDDILTRNQGVYKRLVVNQLQESLDRHDTGLKINNIDLVAVAPPQSTVAAFNEVTNAGNVKSELIDKAREYRVREENNAMSMESEIIASAETYKMEVVSQVRAEAVYFQQIFKEYKNNPETVLMALYNNALSEVLSAVEQKYILNRRKDGNQEVRIKINPELKQLRPANPDNQTRGNK